MIDKWCMVHVMTTDNDVTKKINIQYNISHISGVILRSKYYGLNYLLCSSVILWSLMVMMEN
jgi:hypothetical protein